MTIKYRIAVAIITATTITLPAYGQPSKQQMQQMMFCEEKALAFQKSPNKSSALALYRTCADPYHIQQLPASWEITSYARSKLVGFNKQFDANYKPCLQSPNLSNCSKAGSAAASIALWSHSRDQVWHWSQIAGSVGKAFAK